MELVRKSRNLIPFPYDYNPRNEDIITYLPDGKLVVNGTSSATYLLLKRINLVGGRTYTLSGCPAGGATNTYNIYIALYDETDTNFGTLADFGYGRTMTLPDNTKYGDFYVVITKGYTANNLVFKPMLNEGETALPFEPYTQVLIPVTRSRNLIPFPYLTDLASVNSCFKVDYRGVITANGTSIRGWQQIADNTTMTLEAGKTYTLSGCPTGGNHTTYKLQIEIIKIDGTQVDYIDIGNGGKIFTMPEYTSFILYLHTGTGYVFSYLTFKPMLNEGDTALPFEPYIQRYNLRIKQNLINVDEMLTNWLVKNDDGSYTFTRSEAGGGDRFSKASSYGLPVGKYIFFAEGLKATAESSNNIYLSFELQNKDGTKSYPLNILEQDILNGSINRVFSVTKTCKAIHLYIQYNMPANSSVTFKNPHLYRLA